MKFSIYKFSAAAALLWLLILPRAGWPAYEYIDINNPFLRKIPIAIPEFVNLPDSAAPAGTTVEPTEILTQAIVFTRFFKIIDREAYLIDPQKPALGPDQIAFNNWTTIGAELLITGGIKIRGDLVDIELRMFDTVNAKQLIGKYYHGKISDQRRIILRFCSEIIKHLTGSRGVFNSKIAFVSNGTGNKEIYIAEFDGQNIKRLTNHNTISLFPSWSSKGDWLAYTTYAKGKPDIYIRNLQDNRIAAIAKKGINLAPVWRPGKFELAATLSYSGDQEIYLLTGTGKIIKRITRNWGSDVSPTWSPDGKRIAFVSNRSGSPQIYVKDIISGRAERLTFEGKYNTQPSWSPKGDKITYTSLNNGQSNISVIDIEEKQPVQLTHDAGKNESPSWSPDGSLIVFSSTREGQSRIYVMSAFGTDPKRLFSMRGEQSNPKWSPNFKDN